MYNYRLSNGINYLEDTEELFHRKTLDLNTEDAAPITTDKKELD